MRDHAGRVGGAAVAIAAVLSPVLGSGAAVPVAAGLAASYVDTTLSHARIHARAPRAESG